MFENDGLCVCNLATSCASDKFFSDFPENIDPQITSSVPLTGTFATVVAPSLWLCYMSYKDTTKSKISKLVLLQFWPDMSIKNDAKLKKPVKDTTETNFIYSKCIENFSGFCGLWHMSYFI